MRLSHCTGDSITNESLNFGIIPTTINGANLRVRTDSLTWDFSRSFAFEGNFIKNLATHDWQLENQMET
ncbi:hypothetical protein PG990_014311 [Apiospora arundinis]